MPFLSGLASTLLGIGMLIVMVLGFVFLFYGIPKTSEEWYPTLVGTGCVVFGYVFGSAWMKHHDKKDWPAWPFIQLNEATALGAGEDDY